MKLLSLLFLMLICEHLCAQSQVDLLNKDVLQPNTVKRIGPGNPYYFGGFISPVKPFEHLEQPLTDRLRLSPFVYPISWNYQEGATDAFGLVARVVENSLVYVLEKQLIKRQNKNWFTSALLLGALSK